MGQSDGKTGKQPDSLTLLDMGQSDGKTLSHMGQSNDKIDQTYVKQREHIVLPWSAELHNTARLAICNYQEGIVFHNTALSTVHSTIHSTVHSAIHGWNSEISNIGTQTWNSNIETQTFKTGSQITALNTVHSAIYNTGHSAANRAVHNTVHSAIHSAIHGTIHNAVCSTPHGTIEHWNLEISNIETFKTIKNI